MPIFPDPDLLNPRPWPGLRIGLLGGSFSPPHEGHVHISRVAMRILRLDCVWWLPTPQNPFKPPGLPYAERTALCRSLLAREPRIVVSDLEARIGSNRTCDTLEALLPRFSSSKFVLLTGYDNAHGFHCWKDWRRILAMTATGHVARPPALSLVRSCPLRALSTQRHIVPKTAGFWPLEPHHTYWMANQPLNGASSTFLRRERP